MKRLYFTCFSFFAIALMFFISPAKTSASSVMLMFETQALDLDTGTITELSPDLLDGPEGTDVRLGYHADRVPHVIVMAASENVTLAIVSGKSFDSVTITDVAGLSSFKEVIDQPLETNDIVVVKTDTGATFKLGNVFEDAAGAFFSYDLLQ